MIVYTVFIVLFVAAAFFDVAYLRLPNILSLLLLALFIAVVAVNAVAVNPGGVDWIGHGLTGAAVFAVGALCFHLGYWGGGDVKLYAVGALWMGPDLIAPFVVAVSLLAGLVALVLLALRRIARWGVLARGGGALPPVLMANAGVPLGLPLAAAAILLSVRLPPALWIF
jgi:prepilin peptidase CpaA